MITALEKEQAGGLSLAMPTLPLDEFIQGLDPWWVQNATPLLIGAGIGSLALIAMIVNATRNAPQSGTAETMPRSKRIKNRVTSYAEPLAVSAANLLWRFKEILLDGSGQYIEPTSPNSAHYTYRRESTAYRLAAMLGVMRIIDRDTHVLNGTRLLAKKPLVRALEAVASALADGVALTEARTARLCDVWGLPPFDLSTTDGDEGDQTRRITQKKDAIAFDACLVKHFASASPDDTHALVASMMALNRDELLDAFRKLAFDLARIRGVEPPSPNRVLESVEDTARALAFREALIYREWQTAIGDWILDPSKDRVCSFAEFQNRLSLADPRTAPWLRRLLELFEGVEIQGSGEHDSRPAQLRQLAEATAKLVLVLARFKQSRAVLSKETIALAKSFVQPTVA